MVRKIKWTIRALNDLHEFIAKDSKQYAQIQIENIQNAVLNLLSFPMIGLTPENMLKISYLQLKSLKEEKGRVKERIRLLEGSLHMGCDEAYGALAELLRDNFDSLSHHDRMGVLRIIEDSKNVGCI